LLDNDSSVELDHLCPVLEPLQRRFFLGVGRFLVTVGFRSLQSGGILAPLAANCDGIQFEFGAAGVFKLFKVREYGATGGNAELRLASGVAEGVHKHVFGDNLLHDVFGSGIDCPPFPTGYPMGNRGESKPESGRALNRLAAQEFRVSFAPPL